MLNERMEFKVIAEKIRGSAWIVMAIATFLFTLIYQTIYRSNAWPFDYLKILPTFLGDIIAMIFWIGAGPLVIAFLFLIPITSIRTTIKLGIYLTFSICLFNPMSTYYFNLIQSGQNLQYKTLLLNMISLIIPLFFVIVILPKVVFNFLRRKI